MIDLLVGDKVLLHPTRPREFRRVTEISGEGGFYFKVEDDSTWYTVETIAEILEVSELRA